MSTSLKPKSPVKNECRNCGGRVSADFARVFGDNDGVVHRCMQCTCQAHLFHGGGADPDKKRRVSQALFDGRREVVREAKR